MNTDSKNNIFTVIANELAKTDLSELYLTTGIGFGLSHESENISLAISQAQADFQGMDAHEIIGAHWNLCRAFTSAAPVFTNKSSGLITADGICIEVAVQQIKNTPKTYRALFTRVDAKALLTETRTRLDNLESRIQKIEQNQKPLSAADKWIRNEIPAVGQKIIALFSVFDQNGEQTTWVAGEAVLRADNHVTPMPESGLSACKVAAIGGWIPFPMS
jgi:hypothetical protein